MKNNSKIFGGTLFLLLMIATMCFSALLVSAADLYESEPNDSAAQANLIPFGSTMAGELVWERSNVNEDWFKVTATEQGSIEFDIRLSSFSRSATGNTYYATCYYQDANGTISPYFNDYELTSHSGSMYKTQKIRVQAGTYYLKLKSSGTTDPLSYEVTPIFTSEGSGYEREFNNTKETANEISVNTPITGNISGPYDDDYFMVVAPTDGIMQLKIEADTSIYYNFGTSSPNAATEAQVSLGSFKTDNFVNFRYGKEIKASAGDIYYIWVGNASVPATCFDDYTITMLFTKSGGNTPNPGPEPTPNPEPNPGNELPPPEENGGNNQNSGDFSGESISAGAKLWWSPIRGGMGYRVYRSGQSGEEGISVTDFYITSNEFVDVNVDANKTYYYTVRQVIEEARPFEGLKEVLGPPSAQIKLTMGSVILGGDGSDAARPKQYIMMTMDSPMMNVNGHDQEIDPGRGTTPLILNNRTMVPIRAIIEAMGGTVGWDNSTSKISLAYENKAVEMWLNNRNIQVDGIEQNIDVAPTSINDRTMVPIRFAAENIGQEVEWINSERKIVIVYQ